MLADTVENEGRANAKIGVGGRWYDVQYVRGDYAA